MDDFDSSHIDFGDPDIDPSDLSIGQKSIDTIIANAKEDRIASQRTLKRLQFGHGAPSTRAEQKLWVKRFEAFREHTLGNDPTIPFTGPEVIRFLDSIISKVPLSLVPLYLANVASVIGKLKPAACDKPVPSVVTIVRAYEIIIDYGVFTWSEKDGYHITRQDESQFRAFLDNAVKAGRLMKGSGYKLTEEKGRYEFRVPGDTRGPPPPSCRDQWVKEQPCVVDDCSDAPTFPSRSVMLRHLTAKHKLSEEEANALLDTKARFESVLIQPGRESRKRKHSPE